MSFTVSGPVAYPVLSMVTATSSIKTPTATGQYQSMTTNSVSLTAGTWMITGFCVFDNSGSPVYSQVAVGLWGANGADSASVPTTTLSGISGITVNSANNNSSSASLAGLASNLYQLPIEPTIVTMTTTQSVFIVPFASMTTASSARITTYLNAQRIY